MGPTQVIGIRTGDVSADFEDTARDGGGPGVGTAVLDT